MRLSERAGMWRTAAGQVKGPLDPSQSPLRLAAKAGEQSMKRLALAAAFIAAALPVAAQPPHNIVIFVADGLRYASVTPDVAPTFSRVRRDGVDFANSHAVYPTLTTANASAIATGHFLGDTGDYANVLYTGFPLTALAGTSVPFLENDAALEEIKAHFGEGYMGPTSLLCAAARAGY